MSPVITKIILFKRSFFIFFIFFHDVFPSTATRMGLQCAAQRPISVHKASHTISTFNAHKVVSAVTTHKLTLK